MDDFDDAVLAEWQAAANAENFPVAQAAVWYSRVQAMRERADYYERSLIRHLKFGLGLTWEQVAEVVNANLGSRQAAHVKWKRLLAPDRGAVRSGRTGPGRRKDDA